MGIISVIKSQLGMIYANKQKRLSVSIVLVIELITITPLCGYLFQCGCDWPWFGLDANCNIHQSHIKHQCPWCVSMIMGVFSTAVAIMCGVVVSGASLGWVSNQSIVKQVLIRVIVGLTVYIFIAGLMAILAVLVVSV